MKSSSRINRIIFAVGMVVVMTITCFTNFPDEATVHARAAQITGLSPTSQPVCGCIPEDISRSLEKMALATKLLADQLAITEMREVNAQAELIEARAEIERLKDELFDTNHALKGLW